MNSSSRPADELLAEVRAEPRLRVSFERAELQHREDAAAPADALAAVEDRPPARQRGSTSAIGRAIGSAQSRKNAESTTSSARSSSVARPGGRLEGQLPVAADERVLDPRGRLLSHTTMLDACLGDPGIMIPYGHAPARSILRRRRAAELLAGGGAARRHAAGGEPADPLAREAARPAARSTARAGASSRPRPAAGSTGARSGCSRWRSSCSPSSARKPRASSPAGSRSARRPGPGGTVLPVVLAEFQQLHPGVHVALSVSDTQRVDRAGRAPRGRARRRRRGAPPPRRRLRAVLPRRGRARGSARPPLRRTGRVTLDELKEEPLVLMQEGAGVRQVIDDELREAGRAPARPRRAARARPAGVGAQRGARAATA